MQEGVQIADRVPRRRRLRYRIAAARQTVTARRTGTIVRIDASELSDRGKNLWSRLFGRVPEVGSRVETGDQHDRRRPATAPFDINVTPVADGDAPSELAISDL